jgi:hypothetical protein
MLKRRFTKGFVELAFSGNTNNKARRINLTDISSIKKKDLPFSFQYFQVLRGEFTLPDNFKPESLSLTVNISKTRGQKKVQFEQTSPWLPN